MLPLFVVLAFIFVPLPLMARFLNTDGTWLPTGDRNDQ